MPLVQAREAQLAPATNEPVASTSNLKSDDADESTSMAVDSDKPIADQQSNEVQSMDAAEAEPPKSKRAQKRAKAAARLARRQAAGPSGKHEMTLKSGKVVQIPTYISPDKFEPTLLLDKGKAREQRPEISPNLIIGINAVTRALEAEVHNGRRQLAGLSETTKVAATQQDSLRMILPAPTKSTRRQRRAIREENHPESKAARIRKLHKERKASQVVPPMPEQYAHIPRDEPTLLHSLSEAREEVKDNATAITAINTLDKEIRSGAGPTEPAGPDCDNAEPVKIPLQIINDVLQLRCLDASTRSVLQHLVLRFIPGGIPKFEGAPNDPAARDGRKAKSAVNPKRQARVPIVGPAIQPSKPIRVLFVAKGDINPPSIVQHLLMASAARNSVCTARRRQIEQQKMGDSRASEDMYLVPMAAGFESRLCELLAIRRAAVLAITVCANPSLEAFADVFPQECDAPGYDTLLQLLKHHFPTPVTADWLMPSVNGVTPATYAELLPTHVKQLAVEVPTDPRAARTDKKDKRAENKASRKRARDEADSDSETQGQSRRPGMLTKKAKSASGPMKLLSTQVM